MILAQNLENLSGTESAVAVAILLQCPELAVAKSVVVEARIVQSAVNEAERIVVCLWQTLVGVRESGVRIQIEFGTERCAEICSRAVGLERLGVGPLVSHGRAHGIQRPPSKIRHVNRPQLVLQIPADEEAHLLRAAAGVHAVTVPVAQTIWRRCRIHQNVVRREAVQDTRPLTLAHERAALQRATRRVVAPRCVRRRIFVSVTHGAALGVPRPARVAGAPFPRANDNDAVGRVRTVQRSGRGALHNLDIFDLVRIEVIEQASCCATRAETDRPGSDPYPVNDVDRVVRHAASGSREGTQAADTYHRRRAGHRPWQDNDTWRLGDKQIAKIGHRRRLDPGVDVA